MTKGTRRLNLNDLVGRPTLNTTFEFLWLTYIPQLFDFQLFWRGRGGEDIAFNTLNFFAFAFTGYIEWLWVGWSGWLFIFVFELWKKKKVRWRKLGWAEMDIRLALLALALALVFDDPLLGIRGLRAWCYFFCSSWLIFFLALALYYYTPFAILATAFFYSSYEVS